MYIIPYLYISTNIHTRAKLGNHTECRRTRKSNATPFFVCGERCFEIRCNPHHGPQLASTSSQSTEKKVLPSFVKVSKFPRLGSSAKLLTLGTLAYQDFVPRWYSESIILAATCFATAVSPLPLKSANLTDSLSM